MSWITGLSTRARTLLVGCILSPAALLLTAAVPVPYVALGPGSTFNVIGEAQGHQVITFTGEDIPAAAAEQPTGNLNMLTITIVSQIPMLEAVGRWATGRHALAPREEYFLLGQSVDEYDEPAERPDVHRLAVERGDRGPA